MVDGHCTRQGKMYDLIRLKMLTDLLQNQKRWEQALKSAYIKVLDLVHENLLPALEKCSVIASRLRGLSLLRASIPVFHEASKTRLSRILHDLDVIRVISHRIVVYASEESRSFTFFSTWLSHQIAMLRAEPGSAACHEAAEKSANIDHGKLLSYIRGPMLRSRLNFFLHRDSKDIVAKPRPAQQQLSQPLLHKILERHRILALQPQGNIVEQVNLMLQALFLKDSVDGIAEIPAKGLVENMRRTEWLELGDREYSCHDIKMDRQVRQACMPACVITRAIPLVLSNEI